MDIRELRTDADIAAAFPLMKVLRERIERDTFLDEVRRQQAQGYRVARRLRGGPAGRAGGRPAHAHALARRSPVRRRSRERRVGPRRRAWTHDDATGSRGARRPSGSRASISTPGSRRRGSTRSSGSPFTRRSPAGSTSIGSHERPHQESSARTPSCRGIRAQARRRSTSPPPKTSPFSRARSRSCRPGSSSRCPAGMFLAIIRAQQHPAEARAHGRQRRRRRRSGLLRAGRRSEDRGAELQEHAGAVARGERIAQGIFLPAPRVDVDRGRRDGRRTRGGFGATG